MDNEIYKAAIEYANRGLAVLPVNPRNKHPYLKHGVNQASKNLQTIKGWWDKWPNANVAIACGNISGGLVVIDQDIDEATGKDGITEFKKWCIDNNVTFPDSWLAMTGGGGYHLYLRSEQSATFKNAVSILDGVDIRTDGGYVIAPPSIHNNGRRYEWEYPPDEYELCCDDANLNKLMKEKEQGNKNKFELPQKIGSGSRNTVLFQLASSLQSQGLPDDAIMAATKQTNITNCTPPLDDDEVEQVVSSAIRYKKGELKEIKKVAPKYRPPQIATKTRKDGTVVPEQTIYNCEEAIQWDESLFGHIRYNVLSYSIYIYSNIPWNDENARRYREWTNNDDSNLRSYLEKKYGLNQDKKINDALNIVANRFKYNPIVDLLKSCHDRWDGEGGHIRTLLPDYLGVEDSEYQAETMQTVMLGAIARAHHPGVKFDYMMTIIGSQGCGKSTFVRRLAMNDDWFCDSLSSLEGEKAAEKLRGKWIIEMGELLGVKKAKDVEAVKSFLTTQCDTYRPPYERRTEDRPRSCIFVGTTNSKHFLTDQTGNRRYLPIVARPEFKRKSIFNDWSENVAGDFVQAWGEAMDLYYHAGGKPRLILSRENQKEAEYMQGLFLEEEPIIGIVQNWLDETKYKRVCTAMIYREALDGLGSIPKKMSNILSDVMDKIDGWHLMKGKQRVEGYGIQKAYERDEQDLGFKPIDSEQIPFI